MDIEQNCILLKNKDGEFQEKTNQISSCRKEGNLFHVKFSNSFREYKYNSQKVIWLKNPDILDGDSIVVKHQGKIVHAVDKVYYFGDYYRVLFLSKRAPVTYPSLEINIVKNHLNNQTAKKIFTYLTQLAFESGIHQGNDPESLLSKQYKKLSFIDPASILADYLKPTALTNSQYASTPIFPFGFNLSQKKATERALSSKISIIEGPPGTGKTQTILNIIANTAMQGKTVAVVSNNNSATANVYEKLQKYGIEFIAASLGNRANKEVFFDSQSGNYPSGLIDLKLSQEKVSELKKQLDESSSKLEEMLAAKNDLAALQMDLDELNLEKQYFEDFFKSTLKIKPYKAFSKHNSSQVVDLWIDFEKRIVQGKDSNILHKIKNLFKYGIYSFSFYNNEPSAIISHLQNSYYTLRENELLKQIKDLKLKLDKFQFDKALQINTKRSMELFIDTLARKYNKSKRNTFSIKTALWKDYDLFIREYPIILSTTHSLRSCADKNFLFDYVIMDEASQIDIVTGALALSCAKKAVIVGDLKQLPNVVPNELRETTDKIFMRANVKNAYHYANNSILSSIARLFKDIPKTLLREHYRCHPKIIDFCNKKFYNNELIVLTQDNTAKNPLVVYKTAKGNHARGTINQRQIDVIIQEILPAQVEENQSIGIVSPYRKQVNSMQNQIEENEITIDTVHKYQGRERDIMILSTVVNQINDFVDDPNLLNVAVSRAVNKLVVVISENEKNMNSNIGDLVKYLEYNNFQIIKSNIYSIFDLLYSCYSDRLKKTEKNRKKVSEHVSENLMNTVIEKVLQLPEFSKFGAILHIPLKMLVRNTELLDEPELKFAMNEWTHIDFMIFNKLDKMPILAIEVDGYSFHAEKPKQKDRDKIKDSVLDKIGLPLLRFATNESQEEKRLIVKLNELIGT